MAENIIKRELETRSTSLGASAINGIFTNTGQDASITFTRIDKLVIMHGWFKTGSNITSDLNTWIFYFPQGFIPQNRFEFIGANEADAVLKNFYVDASARVFTRSQLDANKTYIFSHCYLGY